MKYVRFSKNDKIYYGILNGEIVTRIDGTIFEDYKTTSDCYNIKEIKLLSPTEPSKIVAVGLNYKLHAEEFGQEIPDEPIIFLKPPTSVIGHGDYIVLPWQSQRVDYEAELAIVIAKTAKDISINEAKDYVLGYTCLNDVTARDLQKKDGQWTRAKGFDTFCPIGPCIETDITPNNVKISLELNGGIKQQSSTDNFIFNIEFLISYISNIMTLFPGDIITTGTPSGIGKMKVGDEVKVIIEGIGELVNYIR